MLRVWQPFVHIVSPAAHALQSVPAALHADGQVVIVVVHAALALHIAADVLTPFVHDWAAPHSVPTGLLPLVAHTDVPVAHDVRPTLHGSVGVQATPAVHGTQLPVRQTRFVPQLVPFATAVPVSWQLGAPVVQVSVPVWQGLGGAQAAPDVHGLQTPSKHTRLVPHVAPFGRFPTSVQTEAPVTQEVAPLRHRVVGVQEAPAVHAPQMPLLHTMFVPHVVPFTRFLPVSAQVIAGAQAWVPAWQGFAGIQDTPTVHGTQIPALHTKFVPQEVPLATFADSAQTGAPVLHVSVPVRQGLPVTAQLAPTLQSPQTPVALHTLSVPQLVPAATSVFLSVQTGAPVEQASVP